MERLTNTGSNGEIWITDNDETRRYGRKESAYRKLKEYEDMEENHLLLKLPCKVGDTVYFVKDDKIEEFAVTSFDILRSQMFVCNYEGSRLNIKNFGKEVFLTKEEAEKFAETQEKREPEKSLVGKRYLDKQRLPGTLKEVVDGPDKWGDWLVKDLKTGKKHFCSGRYIMQNEVDEKSFEEWWEEKTH